MFWEVTPHSPFCHSHFAKLTKKYDTVFVRRIKKYNFVRTKLTFRIHVKIQSSDYS